MDGHSAVDSIVAGLRETGTRLSGDDSPLPDMWEEMKDQLQQELSPYWPAYLETLRQFTAGLVAALNERDLATLQESLKCRSIPAIERKLVQRLLNRGKRERVLYRPLDFEYFCYPLLDFTVYGQVVERTGLTQCYAKVFSVAAPTGEYGLVDCLNIDETLTAEQFERARLQQWPVAPAVW